MASQIDISGLTLNPEEAREVGQVILERALVQGLLSEVHDISTGIDYKTQIPFAGRMADSLKASTGCTPNNGTGIAMTEKFWEPERYDARWTHCAADLDVLLKIFAKAQRMNPDFYDRINSQELGVVIAFIEQMLTEVLPEKVWFSDKNADFASGTGVFTAGADLDLYNVIDGIFVEIFADASIPKVDITPNAGANYAAQALTTDYAFNLFEDMVEEADSRLLEDGSQFFLVTRSLADNYKSTLRTKGLSNGYLERTEDGTSVLKFDGIPVIVKHEWDRFIKANQNDGTKWNLPHRALLTVKENIPVGTKSEQDFGSIDSFYDRTLKSNIMDVVFTLDAKHLESYMSVVAY